VGRYEYIESITVVIILLYGIDYVIGIVAHVASEKSFPIVTTTIGRLL